MKKIILLSFLALSLSGCISTIKHVPLGQTIDVYRPTCFVACNGVGVWFNEDYCKKYPIEASWMKLTWLVWLVDLPCEAVSDTLWFPYDFYCKKRYEKKRAQLNEKLRLSAPNKKPAYMLTVPSYEIDIDN